MKLAVCADLQFDDQPAYSTLTAEGVTSRLLDFIECFNWIVDDAVSRRCDKLLLLGDIFDSRTTISLSVLHYVCKAVADASKRIEIAMLVGNHDSMMRVPTVNSLQVFSGVATIYEEPTVDGELAFLPWTGDPAVYREQAYALSKTKGARFLFSHALFEGAVPKCGVGKPIDDVNPDAWAGILLGDVHEPIVLRSNMRYCGAPLQIHYGDAGGARGFLILDTKTAKTEFVENTFSPRFHSVRTLAEAQAVEANDFVWIRAEDAEVSAQIAESLSKAPLTIRTDSVVQDDAGPRIEVAKDADEEELVRQWLRFKDYSEHVVPRALAILEEVK